MKDYERILVAADFSPSSEAAARRGMDLVRRTAGHLLLLHVIQYFPEDLPIEPIAPEGADAGEFLLGDARKSMVDFAKRVGCESAEQQVILSLNSSKSEIVQFADKQGIDLIVMGAHSRHGIADLLGSTASAVVNRAHCDVLVVRPRHS